MSSCRMHEYQVVGRKLPTEKETQPRLYRMRLFAPNQIVAKSRFWYFLSRVHKMKRASGEIITVNEIFEKKPDTVKTFGIWLRYDSRSGTHNMYKEYRELTRTAAVNTCYQDLAARHRARFRSVQIIRVEALKTDQIRRSYTKQLIEKDIKFPLPHRVTRPSQKKFKALFAARRPTTHS